MSSMGSNMLLVSCNWATSEQQDQLLRAVCLDQHIPSNSDCSTERRSSKLTLQQPTGTGNCTFSIRRTQHQKAQEQVYASVCLVSNARLCELAVQRPGDAAPQYISTLRGQQLGDQQLYQLTVDLLAVPGWQLLVIKLLSLQDSKNTCHLCELAVVPGNAAAAQQASPAAGQLQQPLSQMDELRLLNESVARQVEHVGGSAAVPESLQLLFGKATQHPTGGSAAAKSLSAMVAKGMLLKTQEQQQQQQQQQQHAVQRLPASPPLAGAAAAAAAPVSASSGGACSEAVVHAVQRLEGKLDALAGKMLWSLEQLLQQQQQVMQRLNALEASGAQQRVCSATQ